MFTSFGRIALAVLAAAIWVGHAQAAQPLVKIGDGTLTSPNPLPAAFDSATSPTAASTHDPLVQELARSLNYDVEEIYEHVRDHVELTPMYGLQKGARGVILDGYGTSFDQAQFLVEMLRESDLHTAGAPTCPGTGKYCPTYVRGTISLTASDFLSWFGVSDATVARSVLADGGIPATVTGSGSSFTVVMSHIWVKATVSGATKYYDPSNKPHTAMHDAMPGSATVSSAMQYNGTTLLSQGTTGAATNDGASIKGFSSTNFRSKLNDFRDNLEDYLNDPSHGLVGAKIDDILGTRDIVAHAPTESHSAQPGTALASWAGEIPTVFRSAFTVSMPGYANTYYADQMYGKPLAFYYHPATSSGGPGNYPILNGSSDTNNCDWYRDNSTASSFVVTVAIDHPYPAAVGGVDGKYMDRTLSKQVSWRQCNTGMFLVTNDWGDIGKKTIEQMRGGTDPLKYAKPKDLVTGPLLESVAAQYSQYLNLAGRQLGGVYQMHDLIGVHHIDHADLSLTSKTSGGATYQTLGSTSQMLTMDFEAGVSATPFSTSSTSALAMDRVALGGLAIAESAVARQEADGVRDAASLTLLSGQDTLAQTPGTYPVYLATPSNWTAGANIRGQLLNYDAAALTILDNYIATEGYSVLVPQQGKLREKNFTVTNPGNGSTRTVALYDTIGYIEDADGVTVPAKELFRSTFFAFKSTGDGAYVVYDPRRRRATKGGIDVSVEDPTHIAIRRPDTPKASSKAVAFADLTVDPKTGDASYAPSPDITDGSGGFPQSLNIQRKYEPADTTDYGLGVGWKHNWRQTVTLNNDGFAALGDSGGFGAASAMVAIQATADLGASSDTAHLPANLFAAAVAQQWFVDQTMNNTAQVANGIDGDVTFLRRSDGTFVSATPNGAQLVQSGAPTDSLLNRRIYDQVAFTYTGSKGDTRTFSYVLNPSETPNYWEPFFIQALGRKSVYLTGWTFPNGVKVVPTYQHGGIPYDLVWPISIANNIGARIDLVDFSTGDLFGGWTCEGGSAEPHDPTNGLITYKNSSGIKVSYAKSPSLGTAPPSCVVGDPPGQEISLRANLVSFTDQIANTWSYGYSTPANRYYPVSSGLSPPKRLDHVFKPSLPSPTGPAALSVTFGWDGTAQMVTDALGNTYQHFFSPYRGQVTDPLGNTTVSYFDRYGREAMTVDPLGYATLNAYDGRDRLTKSTRPEGDYVTLAYDVRSNQVSKTANPKPGCTSPEDCTAQVMAISYGEGATVSCTNIDTCNQPATITDPRGYVTQYAWNTDGTLSRIRKGLDSGQACVDACPRTDYAYASFSGIAPVGGTVTLLNSTTEKIDSTHNLVTNYNWATNSYTRWGAGFSRIDLQSTAVDPSDLNLVTAFTYDNVGNLTSVNGPRTDLTDVTNYLWDNGRRLSATIDPDPDGAATQPDGTASLARPESKFTYNGDSQLTAVDKGTTTSATGSPFTLLQTTAYQFDVAGNLANTLLTGTSGAVTTKYAYTEYNYYADNRLQCEAQRLNPTYFGVPSSNGCASRPLTSYGYDRVTKSYYDAAGHTTFTYRGWVSPDQQRYGKYAYNANGTLASVVDANNHKTQSSYDSFDRLSQLTFPRGDPALVGVNPSDTEKYKYDRAGNRIQLIRRDGSVITFDYDPAGRQVAKHVPAYGSVAAVDVRYDYDLMSRKCHARFTSSTTALGCTGNAGVTGLNFTLDVAGRLVGEKAFNRALTYTVDNAGNRTQIAWPDGLTIDYVYDALNRVSKINEDGVGSGLGVLGKYSYDNAGRRSSLIRGNGTRTDYDYDGADRLTDLTHDLLDTNGLHLSFAFNPARQVVSRTDNNAVYKWTGYQAGTTDLSFDGLNRDATLAGGTGCGPTLGYDCNGNLRADGARVFAYDPESRLVSGVLGATTLALTYDPNGRLRQTSTGTVTSQFLYAGDALVAEYDGSGTLVGRYVPGPGVDETAVWYDASGKRQWLYADNQGSVIARSNANASGAGEIYAYGPYGEPSGWSGSRIRYTGQIMLPELQLYHYKARVYDPQMGRFLQTDPIGQKDDLNLYAYVKDDPTNKTDPTGMVAGVDDAAEATAALVAVGILAVGAYENGQCSGAGGCIGVAAGQWETS